ncbi:COQ9 family protein [Woodsholea maritima]|uniref:COQ9 family protein n=1 Tax=Woodsholea maritima TaxID=240237 RepID=UPI0003766110|nr:COQ9 family protein [Woodsholea maritima]
MKNENCFPHAEKARRSLLEAALPEAAFEGWSAKTLTHAAREAGLSDGEVELYCPDGVLDLIHTWSRIADEDARVMIEDGPIPNRIRDKIAAAVMIRLDQLAGEEEAAERARARLLLPDGLSRASVMTWATCDMIWRAIGDTSTDGNFYSKRATLAGVYLSTLTQWLNESDPAKPKTRAYLDRRIENVMQIEKTKAQIRKVQASLPDLPAFAAKLRYGFGRRA